jgi:Flp pilus assembly protein TadG
MSLRNRAKAIGCRVRERVIACALSTSATAAVEFAFVLPVMLVAYLGTVEVGGGVTADRKLSNLSLTLANLTARADKAVADTDMNDIFNAAASILVPYDSTKAGMVVTSIVFDNASPPNGYVVWSSTSGPGVTAMTPSCVTKVATTLVPNSIRTAGGSIILAQAKFPYKPVIGYVMTGSITLSESNFMVPRNMAAVPRTNASGVTYTGCSGTTLV